MQPNILLATPAYGGTVTLPYLRSMIAMIVLCKDRGIQISTMITHSGFVSRSRNSAAAKLLSMPQFTHLLTVDADMGWHPETILRLLAADKPIVGCTYPARSLHNQPKFIGGVLPGATVQGGFAKAEYVGCGFMLVKREVIQQMAAAFPERQHKDDTLEIPVWDLFPSGMLNERSEMCVTDDVGFCYLAKKAGYEVWADLMLPMSHTGQATFELGPMKDYLTGIDEGLDKPE
jgi:hypothetical protein